MKGNFGSKPSLPGGIKYDRAAGGVDGNDSGHASEKKKIGEVLDDAGFQTDGYQIKKGTPFVMGAQIGHIFNRMPPGMFIDNQETADIRAQPYKEIVSADGYPGDGWTGGGSDPIGR